MITFIQRTTVSAALTGILIAACCILTTAPAEAGALGYYRFEQEPAGVHSSWYNWEGDGPMGSSVGAVSNTADVFGPTIAKSGQDNNYSLDLTSDNSVNLGNNFAIGTGDFTVEAYLKATGGSGWRQAISKMTSSNAFNSWSILLNSSNQLGFFVRGSDSTQSLGAYSSGSIVDSQWHHVAGVLDRSAGEARLYIDGSLAATADTTWTGFDTHDFNGTQDVSIGARNNADSYFTGYLDEVRFTSAALTPDQFLSGSYDSSYSPAPQTPPASEVPWTRHVIDNTLTGADGVRLYDADGDGDMDVASGWEQSGHSRIYLNPGQVPAVKNPWAIVNPGAYPNAGVGDEDAVMADIDGDGQTDLISSVQDPDRELVVHFAPSDPADFADETAWTVSNMTAGGADSRKWSFSTPMDVNGDGILDIVSGGKRDSTCKVGWFEAPSTAAAGLTLQETIRDLTYWQWHEMGDVGHTMSLIPRDMDGDGDDDMVISDRMDALQGIRWLENPGTGGNQTALWTNHWIGAQDNSAMFMSFGDLDGDGDDDAIVPTIESRLLWYERLDGTGDNWIEHEIAWPSDVGEWGKAADIIDINGDGQLDVVLTTNNAAGVSGLVWLEYETDPTDFNWIRHEISGLDGEKFDINAFVDLDGDGDLDIINTEETTNLGVIWYENPVPEPATLALLGVGALALLRRRTAG